MKSLFLSILFIAIAFWAQAQDEYFQQEVNYKINVTLNDQNHTLAGDIEIKYTNNSPQTLHKIYMHLWPNAYSSRNTAFAKQKIRGNSNRFYFAKDKDMGNISNLDFLVDSRKVQWQQLPDAPDIALITLNEPLEPQQTISIQTPFHVKIPASFSRLGHVKTSYQIMQWYPKPAVFDRKGWHPIPYLDQGEFYSEFGDFDVTLTLPQNYVVGATGLLQTESEKKFLAQKIAESKEKMDTVSYENDFPASAKELKTIRYTAKKVHDFAWFADKRFLVSTDTLKLASGKIIDVYAMFPPDGITNWEKATDYIKRSVKSYTQWVGEYPYPQATAIQSALSAGGGMEYPMITVIGETYSKEETDDVIAHEVGHNWFYGILASNEREHAWMDEGMNTFYENRYIDTFYPKEARKKDNIEDLKLLYLINSRFHLADAINAPVETMNEMNYGLTAYAKPSLSLKMLEAFVGRPTFDRIMKKYFDTWKFKHPYPEDFQKIWTQNTDKNLDWFFDDILNSTKTMDYKLLSIKNKGNHYQIKATNKGQLKGPLLLYAVNQDEEIVDSLIIDGFTGTKTIDFPILNHEAVYDGFEIDSRHQTLDLHPQNNSLHGSPTYLKFAFSPENYRKKYLYYLPIYGWNEYDKSMLGISLFNEGILQQKLFYSLMPMYSFGAKTIVGTAEIQYPIYTKGLFRKITPRIAVKRFSFYQNPRDQYSQAYIKITPSLIFELPNKKSKQAITLRHELIQTDQPDYDNQGHFKHLNQILNQFSRLDYSFIKNNAIRHYHFTSGLEYAQYDNFDIGKKQYLKLTGRAHALFTYRPHKQFKLGIQGGYFLQNDARYSSSFNNGLVLGSLATSGTGRDDYAFRQLLFGRSQNSGIWGQQISSGNAGIKHPALNGGYGHSNDWMLGINLSADLPIKLPKPINLAPYFDVAFFGAPKTNQSTQMKKMYSGGLQLKVSNIFSINFPIFNNKELDTLLKQRKNGSYWGKVTFHIAMNEIVSARRSQELILEKF